MYIFDLLQVHLTKFTMFAKEQAGPQFLGTTVVATPMRIESQFLGMQIPLLPGMLYICRPKSIF